MILSLHAPLLPPHLHAAAAFFQGENFKSTEPQGFPAHVNRGLAEQQPPDGGLFPPLLYSEHKGGRSA